MGLNALGWIEYDRGYPGKGYLLFRQGLLQYPDSRFFLWVAADCLYRMGLMELAVRLYNKLLMSIQNQEYNNGYNEVVCRLKLVSAYYSFDSYKLAYENAKAILEIEVDKKIAKRLKKYYEAAETYRIRCLVAMGRNQYFNQ